MNIDDIKAVVQLMTDNDLTEFETEEEGRRLSIKRGFAMPAMPVAAPVAATATSPAAPAATAEVDDANYEIVKAPFVGTFYQSPSPDAPAYVKVGQQVSAETVLCIVEAMKVMNEIKAEVHGVVREIMAENASPVQYGQPLFKIEKM